MTTTELVPIVEEKREIQSLHFDNDSCVDVDGEIVSAIVPYLETGPISPTTWFAVYNKNGEISVRINSAHILAVEYE